MSEFLLMVMKSDMKSNKRDPVPLGLALIKYTMIQVYMSVRSDGSMSRNSLIVSMILLAKTKAVGCNRCDAYFWPSQWTDMLSARSWTIVTS